MNSSTDHNPPTDPSLRPCPRNVGSSGRLISANTGNGVAIFTGYDLRAGGVRSAKVTIANAGSIAGRFRLREAGASNTFAADDLKMVVDDLSGERPSTLYRGDIGALPAGGIELGSFEPGEERTYRFLVTLAIDSPNGGQGRGAGAGYEWDLASAGRHSPHAA